MARSDAARASLFPGTPLIVVGALALLAILASPSLGCMSVPPPEIEVQPPSILAEAPAGPTGHAVVLVDGMVGAEQPAATPTESWWSALGFAIAATGLTGAFLRSRFG